MKVTESNFLMMSLLTEEYHELRMLSESGGVWSYIKRAHVGHDNNLSYEIASEIETMSTEADRTRIISDIDSYISELTTAQQKGLTTGQTVTLVLLWGLIFGGGAAVYKNMTSSERSKQSRIIEVIADFKELKARAKSHKIKN